jgi:dGTPase
LLQTLKKLAYDLVVRRAEVQQPERRGLKVVGLLFEELIQSPTDLIPALSWDSLGADDSNERRVCDYIAGMTDPYAQRIYQRLMIPGFGSSRDEL